MGAGWGSLPSYGSHSQPLSRLRFQSHGAILVYRCCSLFFLLWNMEKLLLKLQRNLSVKMLQPVFLNLNSSLTFLVSSKRFQKVNWFYLSTRSFEYCWTLLYNNPNSTIIYICCILTISIYYSLCMLYTDHTIVCVCCIQTII